MSCAHLAATAAGCETAFTVDASRVTFGRGCLAEVGVRARALGMTRAALFTDRQLRSSPWFAEVHASLRAVAIETAIFDDVAIEPTDASFEAAAQFAREARVDGYVSLGGGSVIDTAKAANLYATYPAPLRAYVNAPVGDARAIPGPLAPHLACPTTSGTGSEVTGIAIFDWLALHAKTGIASPRLRPSEALVDPRCTSTMPASVVAASGMDVLCHAAESFTARPFSTRPAPATPTARPLSQGANPWSDLGCREALRLLGSYLERAVRDAADVEAREGVMWAATLAGIAFGNAGVHVPHAMAYAVAGHVRTFRAAGYPDAPLVPHGMAVAVNAPAVFRETGALAPVRHLEAAALLGADVRGATPADAGDVLATRVIELMRAIAIPNGIAGVGYTSADVPVLVAGTLPQQRLLGNAPCEITEPLLAALFERALAYW
ncbi:MAG: iron-containing alcohol dehydrogenase [Deltaproteobacteria bacterium]|nr:iron-containing alcohol dehydrogenase [Deltaproteobacteria bacterium]MDQ3297064.1 iron-containing alcohol dehydrogenase [Myxococcota bacterium]